MSVFDDRQNVIKVRRDNVILRVPADEKSYYMGLGYNVVDERGAVIEETTPTDVASLQRFYKDANKKIAELEAEVKRLKSQKREKADKAAVTFDNVTVEPVQTVQTTGRRRRSKA